MTYHQSSAVSVASVIAVGTVLMLGYRLGRMHAAWRGVRIAKRVLAVNRREAWRHTVSLFLGTIAVLATLVAVGYEAAGY